MHLNNGSQVTSPHPARKKSWAVRPVDLASLGSLQRTLQCPVAFARLLAARNFTDVDSVQKFLEPTLDDLHDPLLMLGMSASVERIRQAVERSEPILIYGDYDVDGTTATVILKTAIERIASPDRPAQVSYHVPHRLREGYGLQSNRLAAAAASGVRLVISVDTGIRAFTAAREAKSVGLDLIVTDHHLPDGFEGVPDAVAVINPAQAGCPYPYKHLCGAGVAFKLAHALLTAHATTESQVAALRHRLLPSFLKLVAIATVADSVELTGENRAMVWLGLRALNRPVQPGLRALMQVARLPLDQSPSAAEVGFRLAPRINAAGRMDVASDVVELLLTRDLEHAAILAEKLDRLNNDRRAIEASALETIDLQLADLCDASSRFAPNCLVLDHPEWHRGVLGILASRVVDRTGRPALVMTSDNGESHGSGRSIEGFHLLDALTAVHGVASDGLPNGLFSRFGGHAHAVGFSLPTVHLALLRERMQTHSARLLTSDLLLRTFICDLELTQAEIDVELCRWLERCAPFGMGNSEPVFLCRGFTLEGPPRVIQEKHICLPLAQTEKEVPLSAMGWSRAGKPSWPERCLELGLQAGSTIDAVFRLRENKHPRYGGVELELIDLAKSTH